MPKIKGFGPMGLDEKSKTTILMSVDQFEVIRLLDLEGMNQESCAERMGVARSTIQRIYEEAKQKVADCIVNGKNLKIEGGDYFICDHAMDDCFGCRKGQRTRS
jgi:predicted DNA-binding protein (UPF0251 family)